MPRRESAISVRNRAGSCRAALATSPLPGSKPPRSPAASGGPLRQCRRYFPEALRSARSWLLLERHAELADEHLLLAPAVADGDALAVHVLDAGGDERDRVPDQVGESVPLLLGRRRSLGRPNQLGVDVLVGDAGRYRGAQIRRPPMLVTA